MSLDSGALDSGRACAMSGNFSNTKDFKGPLCCPGVTRLSYESPIMRGGKRECGFGFAGHYACIEGSCGDGRCEPAEALTCVCPADCPSAVWESAPGSDASTADDAGALVLRDL
jgi:hypothetical protein